jgi:hypothetical protein
LAAANSIQNQKNFNSGGVIADETIADSRTVTFALQRCQAAERTVCSRRFPRDSWYHPVMGTTHYRRKQLLAPQSGRRSFDDVVRAGVYLTSMSDFFAMNGIYTKYFSQPIPARTTIGVAALPLGACVEIDLVVKV